MDTCLLEETCRGIHNPVLERVESRLRAVLGLQVRELRLDPGHRGVVLHGRASSYYAKQLAQHAAMREGLHIEANEIEVI